LDPAGGRATTRIAPVDPQLRDHSAAGRLGRFGEFDLPAQLPISISVALSKKIVQSRLALQIEHVSQIRSIPTRTLRA
jgi:hypothetical protein